MRRTDIGSQQLDAVADVSENHFIPVRYEELAEHLAARLDDHDGVRRRFAAFAERLREVIVQEATAFETYLADAYAPFNPDRDTITQRQLDHGARRVAFQKLVPALTYLFRKANFELVSQEEFETAVAEANSQGIRLRLDDTLVEDMHLCCRGRGSVTRKVRSWRTRFREREVQLPIYQRFAVVVKLKAEPWIYLKLFKNIPRMDIEALLPHARVGMTLLDRIKLAGGGAGAIGGSAYKLLQLFWGVTKVVVIWSKILWILVGGAVVLAVRTISGYRNIRIHRDAERTRNLYFQNLDNNAGVIHGLVAMVCEEEAKEVLLCYALCLMAEAPPADTADLDRRVERFLREQFDARADFQIEDAVETLGRLRLWAGRETLSVVDLDRAELLLSEHWRQKLTCQYHIHQAGQTPV